VKRRFLAPARGGERALQPCGGKILPQAGRTCRNTAAQPPCIGAERMKELAPGRRRPAAIGRRLRLLADHFRIAALMVRRLWHRVEPTSSMGEGHEGTLRWTTCSSADGFNAAMAAPHGCAEQKPAAGPANRLT